MSVVMGPRIVRPKVLVMEQEPIKRLIYEQMLRGYAEVVAVASGGEAVAALERRVIDVMVAAQRMADVLGSEMARFVRARWPRVRVIVVSDDDPWVRAAARGGVVDRVVAVPERPEQLVQAVMDVMWRPRVSA